MRRPIVLVAAVLAIAACGKEAPTSVALRGVLPVADSAQGSGSAAELRLMKARWAGVRDGRDYSFVTFAFCQCAYDLTPVRVTVRGARVAAVHEVASGESRPVDHYYTIEQLFDWALEERKQGWGVSVVYATAHGYPIWLTIGEPERDAGATFRVQDVVIE